MDVNLFLWLWGPGAVAFVLLSLHFINRYFEHGYDKRRKLRSDQ